MLDCIILAGGLGTRLREFVPDKPKPLAPINGVPFLDLLLGHLPPLNKVVLAVGYKASQITSHFEVHSYPFPIEFSIENSPLGTGGAIAQALTHTCSEHILVINGDSFLEFSLSEMLEDHLQNNADITIASVRVDNANRYGKLHIDPLTKQILNFEEKMPTEAPGIINGGVYLIKRTLFESLSFGPIFSLERDAFPIFLKKRMFAHHCKGRFIDIGTGESFLESQNFFSKQGPL